jgi:hypothetical protein
MIRTFVCTLGLIVILSGCGADGEPVAPTVSGKTSVSVNSNSGLSTKTSVGIHFGSN